MTKREAETLPTTLRVFVRVGRPWKRPPKGWNEKADGLHMGGGIWSIRYERTGEKRNDDLA